MKRVTGIGGIFFKTTDPKALKEWYRDHLGIEASDYGATFSWRDSDDPNKSGQTIWSPFPADTKYFEPSTAPFMINYRVDNLDALVDALREEGVEVKRAENDDYGKFAWVSDPDGNRIELWEEAEEKSDEASS